MKTQSRIRPAISADKQAIAKIAAQTDLFPPDMLDDMISGYLTQSSQDIWFVYEDEGQVLSFGFCEPERMTEGTWNLLAIGVDPAKQGNGIGAMMMAHLEETLTTKGERVLLVETMGTPELALTRKFYIKNNYNEEARIRDFYEAGADKVIFWKHL